MGSCVNDHGRFDKDFANLVALVVPSIYLFWEIYNEPRNSCKCPFFFAKSFMF